MFHAWLAFAGAAAHIGGDGGLFLVFGEMRFAWELTTNPEKQFFRYRERIFDALGSRLRLDLGTTPGYPLTGTPPVGPTPPPWR